MSISAPIELTVPEDVLAEVRRKSAEVEFQSFREAVIEHFADAKSIGLYLLEDPDEDDRNWVVFQISLPSDFDLGELQGRERAFYDDLIRRRPHVSFPICSLGIDLV